MSIIGWIVLGLIAGFIASKIVNKQGAGVILDIILGIIGAIVGGFLFIQFGAVGEPWERHVQTNAKSTFLAQNALRSPTLVPSSPLDDGSGLPTAASGDNISPRKASHPVDVGSNGTQSKDRILARRGVPLARRRRAGNGNGAILLAWLAPRFSCFHVFDRRRLVVPGE